MQDFIDKKIILGICGGIAAYKSAYLARALVRLQAEVKVVMTKSAEQFISPLTLQALTNNEVRTEIFDRQSEQAMGHIELARWADYLVIAPASANCMARLAHGFADDLLSTLYLAAKIPAIICPAMNKNMWNHPAVADNCNILQQRGALIIGPDEGSQACGDFGLGRMSEPSAIIDALRMQGIQQLLQGKQVLITAGATQEAIDPVRFISNRSSGKMGYALALAARMAGAKVTLVSAPVHIPPPSGVELYKVISAKEMHDQVMQNLKPGIIFIACAAVSDYSPTDVSASKIKKENSDAMQLSLKLNADIVTEVVKTGKASFIVGFAAETENVIEHARIKLKARNLNMIIANQVGNDKGFDADYNQVTVLTENEQIELPLTHKTRLAGELIAMIAARLHNIAF